MFRKDKLKARSELISTKILFMHSADGAKLSANSLLNMSTTTTSLVTDLSSISTS